MNSKIKFGIVFGVCTFICAGLFLVYYLFLAAPQAGVKSVIFVVSQNQTQIQTLDKLKNQGLIKNEKALKLILYLKRKNLVVAPGGYYLSLNMNAWQIAGKLIGPPDMKWVVIPEGWRKEQIGELLAKTFNWNADELDKWDTVYTKMKTGYTEGTFFPDTYLIPVNESGLDIANRMTMNFDQKFAPYLSQFAQQNIKWTTGLTLASIIQREAAGSADMPLIAGILWNRLNQGMNLQIDATVQYARGNTGSGWWAPITPNDIENIDSPYNTYENSGLPPTPIDNPGIAAIEAVLNPAQTDCLYYLHDNNRQIHCAQTYQEHLANIDQYLKN